MPVRFPTKFRDGFSGAGSTMAAYLRDAAGGDWQKKRAADGSIVSREGQHIVVTADDEQVTGRIYMAAHDAAGVEKVWGSRDMRRWQLIGDAFASTPSADSLPAINHYGHLLVGQFFVEPASPLAYDPDTHDLRWWRAQLRLRTTRNGVEPPSLAGSVDIPMALPNGVWSGASQLGPAAGYMLQAPPGYWGTPSAPIYYTGLALPQFNEDDQQAQHRFICIDGEDNRSFGASLSPADTAPWSCWLNTLAPGRLLRMDTLYYPPDYPAYDDYPRQALALGTHTVDAGQTWSVVALSIINAELAGLTALSVTGYHTVSQLYAPKLLTAPLTRQQSVVVATTPYATAGALAGWRVKMGVVGTDGVPQHRTVLRDQADVSVYSAVKQVLPVQGGVLIVLRAASAPWSSKAQIFFTDDGVTATLVGEMPAVERACGSIMPTTPNVLFVVVRDGDKAYLHRSRDRGATWVQFALIADGIYPPPGPGTEFNPPDFASLAYVERDGRPMSSTPSAPWLTDCRIAHE